MQQQGGGGEWCVGQELAGYPDRVLSHTTAGVTRPRAVVATKLLRRPQQAVPAFMCRLHAHTLSRASGLPVRPALHPPPPHTPPPTTHTPPLTHAPPAHTHRLPPRAAAPRRARPWSRPSPRSTCRSACSPSRAHPLWAARSRSRGSPASWAPSWPSSPRACGASQAPGVLQRGLGAAGAAGDGGGAATRTAAAEPSLDACRLVCRAALRCVCGRLLLRAAPHRARPRGRFQFEPDALEVVVSGKEEEQTENAFVGGRNRSVCVGGGGGGGRGGARECAAQQQRQQHSATAHCELLCGAMSPCTAHHSATHHTHCARWRYDSFINWELWWPGFPVLVYFKVCRVKRRDGCVRPRAQASSTSARPWRRADAPVRRPCGCALPPPPPPPRTHTHTLATAGEADQARGPDPLFPRHLQRQAAV
jgi:hypothetical protein